MQHKPWPLLILAFIHFIEPITKVIFYSFFFNITPWHVVSVIYNNESTLYFLQFLFLFPIAGIAIYAVKKWSLPVFLLVELLVLIINSQYLNELYQTNQLWLFGCFIFFGLLNLTIVTYLLIPAVRIAYVDPKIRWWESDPRYSVNIDCIIDNNITGQIKNISIGGVFIKTNNNLEIDSNARLIFKFQTPSSKNHINTKIRVLHKFRINNIDGYGVLFVDLSKDNKYLLKSIIKFLDRSNVERRPPRRNLKSLLQWLAILITTGKGLSILNKTTPLRKG